MTYELAKQLRDEGFPQKLSWGSVVWKNGVTFHIGNSDDMDSTAIPGWINEDRSTAKEDVVVFPTLSELIEACGGEFHQLVRGVGDLWKASDTGRINREFVENTPTEAVAKLWLALNISTKEKAVGASPEPSQSP